MSECKTEAVIVPVILCGGSGTRLWPASREKHPKQFLKLMGEFSLLQDTMTRALRICGAPAKNMVTVTLGELSDSVREQLSSIFPESAQHILSEPCARDTAAAVAFAASYVKRHFGENAVMWVLPADHHIGDENAMSLAFAEALKTAQQDYLVTFGIRPTRPETGYGYIRLGDELTAGAVYNAGAFVEKPNRETAQSYLDSGEYLWNSGMFLFSVERVLSQFVKYSPEVLASVNEAMDQSADEFSANPLIYSDIPKVPFDKAIMEKSRLVAVVPCNPAWSDIGSWESLWEIRPKDGNGNVTEGQAACYETKNCLVQAKDRLIACAGVENIVVIETDDAVLIADRSNGDAMKVLVNSLKSSGRREVREMSTPSYSELNIIQKQRAMADYGVQEIAAEAGETLTFTGNDSKCRFLTVTQGKALVTAEGKETIRNVGETLFIQSGQIYHIESAENQPLKLIEVNQGTAHMPHSKQTQILRGAA